MLNERIKEHVSKTDQSETGYVINEKYRIAGVSSRDDGLK